jgi:translocation and assembly module TamA
MVVIEGVSGEALENVRASLDIARRQAEPDLDGDTVRALHAQAEGEIRRALEPYGYYRPAIHSRLEATGTDWRASYGVDTGPAVPLLAVDVRVDGAGAQDPTLQSQVAGLPLAAGQSLDHRSYERARASLLQAAVEAGYLDASYSTHRVEVDLAAYTAVLTLHLDTGPRYRFGEITLLQDQFDPAFLFRYLVLTPGEPYSQARITEQRVALSRSGYFREVAIESGEPTGDDPPAIPLAIRLVPFAANRYRARFGWGTDTGIGAQLDWSRRYVGRHGHHFNAGAGGFEDRGRVAADLAYTIPLEPLAGSHLRLNARHQGKDLDYQEVDLPEGGETRIVTNIASIDWLRPQRRLGDFGLESTVSLGFVSEDYDVFEVLFGNLPDNAQQAIIKVIGPEAYATLSPDFEAVTAGLRFDLQRADDELYIRRGDYLSLQLIGADESLGSNISFWQARLASWNIWPVGDSGRLLVRTSLGYSDADSREVLGVTFNQMPEYYEFRAGGARSVRGYGFEKIFPEDGITGGRSQIVASVEYEQEIIPDWGAAVFLDAGDAFNDFDDFDEKLGVGVGVRWRSPVGLARIDLGFPLDDADDAFQIYITVGPEF